MTTTWSPQSRYGVKFGLSFPISTRATNVANRPRTFPEASTTTQLGPSERLSTSRPRGICVRIRSDSSFLNKPVETIAKDRQRAAVCQRKSGALYFGHASQLGRQSHPGRTIDDDKT